MPDCTTASMWDAGTLPPPSLPHKDFIKGVSNIQNGHGRRVGLLAARINQLAELGLDPDIIQLAGELHDTGKVLTGRDILHAPRALTPEERNVIRKHPLLGLGVLQWYKHSFPREVMDAALLHHERWDGTGYPLGLKGQHIPLWVQVVSIADTIDACLSKRNYKHSWTPEAVGKILQQEAGRAFEPKLALLCADHLDELLNVWLADYAWQNGGNAPPPGMHTN
ncbi:HD-GYP domain-containing protein [Acetobacter syzygii]|uniref:HD-GYP domain-containing protein n=1 Tax=Acetobacter syzygii TaxID=146476 RepID=A0A270BEM2_9PROT|nr:HD domain-containing phosphohydrolase [Acetobacter syzygii]NSL92406.1 HD domain-containing protein [Acetobacter syzygii]PAL23459.1 hypothetical protein B9K05_10375 [Acetobacter syzygii]PAL24139.1 hypothetical protein B9K04_10340 [Acetobacter syzygii]GAN71724.1 response regulator [Acetobacter syzygii]GBR62211.1 two component response regulator [Acetobacter syzygii NRIC 0483]